MIAYSILKLLQEDPREELWQNVVINADTSVAELNVQFYNAKKDFLAQKHPRFRQIIRFKELNDACAFDETPKYDALREILKDLYKGEREYEVEKAE